MVRKTSQRQSDRLHAYQRFVFAIAVLSDPETSPGDSTERLRSIIDNANRLIRAQRDSVT